MDLGEVGLLLVTRGEDEARRAIEDYVRASDAATRALEDNAQRLVRAEEARERSIQRQIKTQSELIREAQNLRRSYEDISASFSKMEKATLDYYRTEEMLKKGMDAKVVSATEYARVMELVQQRLVEAAGSIRVQDEEARIALQERANAELAKAGAGYDSVMSSVDAAYAANIRYADSLNKINEAYEAQIISEKERVNAINLVTEQFNRELESPRAKQMEREREEADKLKNANAQLSSEYGRLSASVNPAVRAQQMYDSAIRTLDRSIEKGIINQVQYNATLANVRISMERAGHTVNQFGQVMSKSERGFAKFARGGFQQLGYQVGDFAVQVQSGTSALVAFGQQGAQFAGIFGATGAIIGAVIAIVSSVAQAYLMASGNGKTLNATLDEMESSFNGVNATIKKLAENNFGNVFGDLSEDIKRMTESALALDSAMSLKTMTDTLDKLKNEYIEPGIFDEVMSYMGAGFAVGGGHGIAPGMQAALDASQRQKDALAAVELENYNELGFSMGYETYKGYQRAIDEASKSGDVNGVVRQLTSMLIDAAPDIESVQKMIASGGYDMLNAYRQLALAIAEANAEMVKYRDSEEKQRKDRAKQPGIQDRRSTERLISAARQQEVKESRALWLATNQDRLSDEKLISAARKQGIEQYRAYQKAANQDRISDERLIADARKLADDEAQNRYRDHMATRMSDENLINTARQQGIEQYRAYQQATDQNRRADEKLAQEALAKSLMDAYKAGKDLTLLDLPSGIDAAATVAAELAKQLGISLEVAQKIVGLGKGHQEEIIYDPRQPGYDPQKAYTGRIKAIMEGAPIYEPPKPDEEKSGGSKRDPMEEIRAQIKLEQEMLGLTKEQQRVYQALGEDRSKYSKTELDALAAEIKAIEEKKRAIEDFQSIADTIQSSMTDAFMSMVDGTATVEDAFREMARSIIAQLYEVLVVQQLVGQWDAASSTGTGLVGALMKGISGITTQANGGAWMGGNQLVPYANGGIVMTPTMFGMSGGRRGLMGESGPEAILPLKRTSNGKLGVVAAGGASSASSEHTHIHNNFNISGSDTETVRREIEKALPRIAEVSKASVLDARRRGGVMRATFGG